MIKDGCGQSGDRTLKLTVSQGRIDGMNRVFACYSTYRKAKSS